ncbi:LapA family protein [Paenibacillus crassostreae]|uniref:LapA family protein n=1 Tax=Paenibacillus crassostreae TaxID=1763538 RepID=UPI0009EDA200|nr:lipopolysaccharide assembly protein LapA domain-containing protein [Paenibacillus crassostreae]
MKIQWSLIAGLIFALITALFAVINVDPVQVNFYFSEVSIPLILLILGCVLIGGLIVGSFGIYRQYKLQREVKRLTNELNKVMTETNYSAPTSLASPITEEHEEAVTNVDINPSK